MSEGRQFPSGSGTKWFFEDESDELRYGYAITAELAHVKSFFQDIKVLDSVAYGKMLVIDDVVMITEGDEFVYREMISHVPLCIHRAPRRVLVIGGGDGGVVRELVRYRELEHIVLCEIDEAVVQVCREHFPRLTQSLRDERVEVKYADGIKYLAEVEPATFDVIIVDSTDPIGPGAVLFTADFYRSVARGLCAQGLMVAQTESPWGEHTMLRDIHTNISVAFPCVRPYIAAVPTYPRGLWSWTLAGVAEFTPQNFNKARFAEVSTDLRYLTTELATGAFNLPVFMTERLSRW